MIRLMSLFLNEGNHITGRCRSKCRIPDGRRWLKKLGEELVEPYCAGQTQTALRADRPALEESPPPRDQWPVRLLYRFDPLLLGTRDKGWLIDAEHYPQVWRGAGHIEATLLAHGRLHGIWSCRQAEAGLIVTVAPFGPLPDPLRAALEALAPAVAAFFDLSLSDRVLEPPS